MRNKFIIKNGFLVKGEGVVEDYIFSPVFSGGTFYGDGSNLTGITNNEFIWTIDFTEGLNVTLTAPYLLKIDSIEKKDTSALIEININNSPYIFGEEINKWDEIFISSDTLTVVNLMIIIP